jgi:ABC-type transport system involved in multi-copper enzyme maturation permease subunit
MDFTDKTSKLGTRMMPYIAILQHDMKALWGSRLVRLWLAATAVLTLMLALANWSKFQNAPLIASLLFPYLVFPWFFVVVVLGVGPVSGSRAEALADGILSRPVSRSGYLIAAWFARVVLVWSAYLIVVVPVILLVTLAKRPAVPEDTVTVYGVATALFVVGLVLTFLVSLGFLMGTLLRKPLLAVVVLIFVWYPISVILSVFSLEEFSPISLCQALPTQLRQPWRQVEGGSKVNANKLDMNAFSSLSNFFSVLSPTTPQPKAAKPDFFESKKFANFSLLRVTLGYGLPTLMAVVLATLSFYWRDL